MSERQGRRAAKGWLWPAWVGVPVLLLISWVTQAGPLTATGGHSRLNLMLLWG